MPKISLCFIFVLCLLPTASFASDSPVKISLAIRDNTYVRLPKLDCPLAFRVQNTGTTAIDKDSIPDLFFRGLVHVLPEGGAEEQAKFQTLWRTAVYDLSPQQVFEAPVYGDFPAFFPSLKDGSYQVWWTLGDLRSNILRFTVGKGKVHLVQPEA